VTGGAGSGDTTVVIEVGLFAPTSDRPVQDTDTIDTTGINKQHTQAGSKSEAEVTSSEKPPLGATGAVPNDTTVGRLLDLPVMNQTTNAAGQTVKLVRDTTGAVIEITLDNTGKIIDSRVVNKAPGDIHTSPQPVGKGQSM
jgi:hypothetical protein